jgi:hypothetical protein
MGVEKTIVNSKIKSYENNYYSAHCIAVALQ